MKITRKRILALNLAFLMLLTLLLPVSAADGTAKKVEVTLNANGGLLYANGSEAPSYTYLVNAGEQFDLLNRFYKTGAYVDYFEDENKKIYTTYVVPSENMTLTAHWKVTDCVTPIVFFPDQPGKDITVVNGGEEWTVPDMTGYVNSDGAVETTFICWENEISGRWTTLLPGQKYPKVDRPVSYRAFHLSDQNGIIFCAGDETFENNNGYSVIALSNQTTTNYWHSESGKGLAGWKDKEGNLYGASGVEVPAAKDGWVRLYAQWAPENTIELYVNSSTYGNPKTLYVVPGTSVDLPNPGVIAGQRFYGWDAYYEIGNRGHRITIPSGKPFDIPAGATYAQAEAEWLPEGQLVISEQEFTIEDSGSYYYEDENGSRTASFYYDMYLGNAYLYLDNYNGGPISLPCDTKVTTNEGYTNTITAESGPALSCTGNLGLYSYCKDDKHASLTIKGAPNSPVLKATAGVNIDRAPHTELIAGVDGSIAGEATENLFLLSNCYTYTYKNSAGEQELKGDEGNFASLDADVTSLKIEPNTVTLTVDGNGGTSGGNGIIEKKVEAEQSISLDSLGFTKPGYYRTGYNNDKRPYDVSIETDSKITLNWYDTGFKKFLALDLNGEKLQDAAQDHVYIDNNTGKHVLFLDYSSGKAKIPEIALGHEGSEVLYWYTSYGSKYEQADSKQFLIGETVDQSQVPEGTTLYAKGTASNRNIYLALYANGKTFSGGRRVITRSSNYLPKYTASDGANIYYYSTDPEGKADRYTPGEYADLSRGTKLYAIWLPVGSVPVTIENRANDETNETFAEAGGTITLPTPKAKDGLTFAYWGCSIRLTDGNYTWSELKAGENLPIPEKAAEVRILACWSLNKQVTVNGKSYSFTAEYAYQHDDDNGWSIRYNSQKVKLTLTLDGYHGGSIELPVLADVSVKSTSTINGTLSCADTLRIITECAYGQHSNLTVQAAAGVSALVAPRVYFDRAPHVTLTAGAGAKAIAAQTGTPDVTGNDKITYHGKTDAAASAYTQLTMTEMGLQGVEDLQVFHTEPRMSKLTLDGNGGKTTAGKTSITVDLEYGEGYNLRGTGFKKQYSDVVGFVEKTGTDTYYYYEWPKSIRVQSPAVTLKINWQELGYPYLAFRADGALKGDGIDNTWTSVSYVNRNEKPEVTVPNLVYDDAASNGDLVYWFSSEDGTETDSSRQYLAGEVVSEPDDTTLYARAIRWGQVALVAPGTTFSNGKHVVVSSTLNTTLTSKEGKTIESWNTKPDGTGKSFARDAELQYETPRILYAQWKTNLTVVPETDPETEGKVLQIQQKTDSGAEKVEIKDTSPKEIAFEQAKRVILAAYENGRFVGMVNATASGGVITCRVPAQYVGCELKLFFMDGGKPKQDMEIIRLPARAE